MATQREITKSSSAEYFAKNLQQVGFSSFTKATLTAVKEAVDNSLDACEDAGILPEISVVVERIGTGTSKGSDLIRVRVTDNGPGIGVDDVTKVFGEYLASSKFGRGRCSRGQQGIGISAVTTWAQLTHGKGASVTTKTKSMRQAQKCVVEVDIKNNKGLLRSKEMIDWDRPHGVACEFVMDARVQLNGEGGLITYLQGNALVNPHLTLHYKLLEAEELTIERVTDQVPHIPEATEPHPHTMKLGEFIAHGHLYGKTTTRNWLKTGFSRLFDAVIGQMVKENGLPAKALDKAVSALSEHDYRAIYTALQAAKLMAPSTKSVLSIGEADLAKSIMRLGETDFFAVVSRKPTICDFKPMLVEVAIARRLNAPSEDHDSPVQILRFANRVPLQFDKAACAIVKAIESVNWKAYGLAQPRGSLPQGPYIFAVSLVSPFLKFKNASKETVDASDELVDELRLALIQAGQKLGAHIRRESKLADMERKLQHIEQFAPILVQGLCRILKAKKDRETRAMEGLAKILGRDSKEAHAELQEAHAKADSVVQKIEETLGDTLEEAQNAHAKKMKKRAPAPSQDEAAQMDLDL
jgi:DNA topoisomerase-6 subunit B